jgi:hypothetical protein
MTIFSKKQEIRFDSFICFFILLLGAGIVLHDFYAFPSIAVLMDIAAFFYCSSLPQMKKWQLNYWLRKVKS